LSSLLFKAGASSGCPGPTYVQPCYNPNPGDASVAAHQSSIGVIAQVSGNAPTWDWDGTTLTSSGLLFATSHINSNPNQTQVLSDRVTDVVINTATDTVVADDYECIEGIFLTTVDANGCLGTSEGANSANDSSGAWNVGGAYDCVVLTLGGDDTLDGTIRGPYDDTTPAGGCDVMNGAYSQYDVEIDNGDVLVLANLPHDELASDPVALPWDANLVVYPAVTITNINNVEGSHNCWAFGPGNTGFTVGSQLFGQPCPHRPQVRGISYLVLVKPGFADSDGDGMPNSMDNCSSQNDTNNNADHFDADGDGFGSICDADLNNSGLVTGADYTILRNNLNTARMIPDINHSGLVTGADYTILRNKLNTIPGPSGLRPNCVSNTTCDGPTQYSPIF
jgi:hypothetical protein